MKRESILSYYVPYRNKFILPNMTAGNVLSRIIPVGVLALGVIAIYKAEVLRKARKTENSTSFPKIIIFLWLCAVIAFLLVALYAYLIYDFNNHFRLN
jgi:uncharacterized membrane protein